jgi:putative endonuclease
MGHNVCAAPPIVQRDADKKRRKAYRLGWWAESIALIYLMLKGYRPRARRYGGKGGEIDLIMQRANTIVFVEVKARAQLDTAMVAITGHKKSLMSRTARRWQSENMNRLDQTLRVDAVYITPWRWPFHQINAFELE